MTFRNNRTTLACVALACAGFSSGALAALPEDWGNAIWIQPDAGFHNRIWDLQAEQGQPQRYWLSIPDGVKQLRVSIEGANGDAGLSVRIGSPNATVGCTSQQAGSNEACTVDNPAAGFAYIEVTAKAAYNEALLTVAYLPSFQQMTDVPDFFPFAIADRGAYWTDHTRTAEHCLQVRYKEQGFSLPKVGCMPVGTAQSWHIEKRSDSDYRIANLYNGHCMTRKSDDGGQPGGPVEDAPCTDSIDQAFRLYAANGAGHYVVLQNVGNDLCIGFEENVAEALFLSCKLDTPDMPGWALRDPEERMKHSTAKDGGAFSLIEGVRCLADDGTRAFLAECDDRAQTRHWFAMAYGFDEDWFGHEFVIPSARDETCMSADAATGAMSFRECTGDDPTQRWTAELRLKSSQEWQLRNTPTGKCLVSKDGGSAAGTELVLGDCETDARTARWRYIGT